MGRGRLSLGVALAAFAVCLSIFGCDGCKPSTSSIGYICTWDVPAGQTYTFQAAPGAVAPVNFIGRVYYSTLDSNCTQFTDSTPHPLVVFAHGRYGAGVPNNYLGATHLMNHLASWGYVCISVNMDVVTSLNSSGNQWGIPHRGELMLHAVEYMTKECRTPGSPFYTLIDTTKIALIGHSRGGGGTIFAANANPATKNRPIKAIATISPVNFGTAALSQPVPHMSLYGSWDGDLYDGQGVEIWSRGTRAAPRELVEIYGANHFHFTDNTVYGGESVEISRESHHDMAQGMINAWFDTHVRGLDRYDWPKYLLGSPRLIDTIDYYISYLDEHFLTIDDGAPLGTPLVNNLGGANAPNSLVTWNDFNQVFTPDFNTGPGLRADWNTANDDIQFNFPSTDASAYAVLSFRAAQVHPIDLNISGTFKDWSVIVGDAAGHLDTVFISNYLVGLQYPDQSGSIGIGSASNFKQIMRSFRIPKADLPSIDFTQVNAVRFEFDRPNVAGFTNTSGAIKIEDLEFCD